MIFTWILPGLDLLAVIDYVFSLDAIGSVQLYDFSLATRECYFSYGLLF